MTAEQIDHLVARLAAELQSGRSPVSPYLDVRQAAAYCRCAVQTIYNNRRYIERMPGFRKLLFRRESLDKWLERRRKKNSGK